MTIGNTIFSITLGIFGFFFSLFYLNKNISKNIFASFFDFYLEYSTQVFEEGTLESKIFNLMCNGANYLWCYILQHGSLILFSIFMFFLMVESNTNSVGYNDIKSVSLLMTLISNGIKIFKFLG